MDVGGPYPERPYPGPGHPERPNPGPEHTKPQHTGPGHPERPNPGPEHTKPQHTGPQHTEPQWPYGEPWHTGPQHTTFGHTEPLDERGDPTPPRRRRTAIAVAVGLVVALIAGGLSYAAVAFWYGWSTTQPESVLPGSVAGFARVDLSPGLGQRLRLNNLTKKFPLTGPSRQDEADEFERQLVRGLGLDPLSYDSDIKPWWADRVGVAAWLKVPGIRGQCTLIAMASKNDVAATIALTAVVRAHGASTGLSVADGYALLARCASGDGQAAATAARAEAKTSSLAVRPSFADAVEGLPSGQLAYAYADLSQLSTVAAEAMGLLNPSGSDKIPAAGSLTGTAVAGVQATGDGIELRVRLSADTALTGTTASVVDDLGALSGGTVIGVSADLSAVRSEPSLDTSPLGSMVDGLDALFGSTLSLSVTDTDPDPQVRLVARAADAEGAGKLLGLLDGSDAPAGLGRSPVVTRNGNTVTLTTAGYHGGTGTLADRELFRTAMAGQPAVCFVAGYIDVQRLAPDLHLSADAAGQLAPVRAVGFSLGRDGEVLEGLFRIVIR